MFFIHACAGILRRGGLQITGDLQHLAVMPVCIGKIWIKGNGLFKNGFGLGITSRGRIDSAKISQINGGKRIELHPALAFGRSPPRNGLTIPAAHRYTNDEPRRSSD